MLLKTDVAGPRPDAARKMRQILGNVLCRVTAPHAHSMPFQSGSSILSGAQRLGHDVQSR